MQNLSQAQKIVIGLIVLAILGMAGYYFVTKPTSSVIETETATSTGTQATTTQATSTATTTSQNPQSSQPSLSTLIERGEIAYRAGNYVAAQAAWESASTLYPQNYQSFPNLANLYTKNLINLPKAEINYITATRNTPTPYSASAYRALYEFYTGAYPVAPADIEKVLKEAIQKNPSAVDFYVLLARQYKDTGRTAEAKTQFNAAITAAAGNAQLIAQLEAERDSF